MGEFFLYEGRHVFLIVSGAYVPPVRLELFGISALLELTYLAWFRKPKAGKAAAFVACGNKVAYIVVALAVFIIYPHLVFVRPVHMHSAFAVGLVRPKVAGFSVAVFIPCVADNFLCVRHGLRFAYLTGFIAFIVCRKHVYYAFNLGFYKRVQVLICRLHYCGISAAKAAVRKKRLHKHGARYKYADGQHQFCLKVKFLHRLFHVRLSLFNLDTARKTARLVICWHQYGINYCFNIKTKYGMLYIIVFRVFYLLKILSWKNRPVW